MDVLQIPIASLVLIQVATITGFFAHVLLKVGELRDAEIAAHPDGKATVTFVGYFMNNPYKTVSKLIVVVGSTLVLAEPSITPMALAGAAGIGYAADSATNKFGSKS